MTNIITILRTIPNAEKNVHDLASPGKKVDLWVDEDKIKLITRTLRKKRAANGNPMKGKDSTLSTLDKKTTTAYILRLQSVLSRETAICGSGLEILN